MLEGLEIVEIDKKHIEKESLILRIDSEFFQKRHLFLERKISKLETQKLKDLTTSIRKGIFDISPDNYRDEGVPFLRVQNIKNTFLDSENCIFIDSKTSSSEHKTEIGIGDIALSKVGSTGNYCLLMERANTSQNVVSIKVDKQKINPFYLFAFLTSSVGQLLTERLQSVQVQAKLELADIRNLEVPSLSKSFQLEIEMILMRKYKKLITSKSVYKEAETLLLDTLGMADFSPDTETVNIKSFKDSFAATGRLDAEYYQPKYEQVMAHITAQSHDNLAALVTIKKSIEPGSDEYSDDEKDLPFMRVADYSKFGVTPPQKKIRASFVAENKDKLDELMPKAGTILFSKDGSVGEAYCLRENADFITSGAVLHLTVRDTKKLLPDYLTLALNSSLVKMQAERDAGGSIILHWRVGEIENVVVPLVDMPTQQKIAALVQQSFTLKAESERLLAVAKRAVEMAIEQDEAAAMAYLAANA